VTWESFTLFSTRVKSQNVWVGLDVVKLHNPTCHFKPTIPNI